MEWKNLGKRSVENSVTLENLLKSSLMSLSVFVTVNVKLIIKS